MKKLLIVCCLAAIAANAIESATVAIPRAVVVDDFEYMLVPPSVWDELTNTVARLKDISAQRWRKEHETVAGRQSWHGAATNRIIRADAILWLYPDGYIYEEKLGKPIKHTTPPAARIRPSGASAPGRRASLPPRLAAKREAMAARPKAKAVNAIFGPGGKLIRAEEAK